MKRRKIVGLLCALALAFGLGLTGCKGGGTGSAISAEGLSVVYNGLAQLPEITVSGGEKKTVEIYRGDAKVDEAVAAGSYVVKVTAGKETESFDFTIAPKPLTITSLSGEKKEYDGTADFSADIVSPVGTVVGDELTATVTGKFADAAVGDAKPLTGVAATLSGRDKDNYTISAEGDFTADLTPKELTVTGLAIADVLYGDLAEAGIENFEPVCTGEPALSGVVAGEEVTLSLTKLRYSALKVGTVPLTITATLSGKDAGNYTLKPDALTGKVVEDDSVFSVSADGTLTAYHGTSKAIVIPSAVGGVTVRAIGESAFENTSITDVGIESVELPGALEVIGAGAFKGNALTSVVIPGSVREIGESAFYYCESLSSIDLGGGTVPLTVGTSAFEGTAATDVTIPARMTAIPRLCFADTTGSGYLKVHNAVASIGREALLNRSNENGFTALEFEAGGEAPLRLEQQALAGARITEIEIPARCVYIGFACMQNAKYLASLTFEARTLPMEWGQNESAGGPFTFAGCASLTSVTLPKELGTAKMSFQDCANLRSVIIEEGITEIGAYAFFQAGIASVTIPKSVSAIGLAAFQNCASLTTMTVATGEGEADLTIADWAFAWCPITSLHFPARVVSIGFATFKNHGATAITFELVRDKTLNFEHHPFAEGMADESSAFNLDGERTMEPVVLPKNINLTLDEIAALAVFPRGTSVTISEA